MLAGAPLNFSPSYSDLGITIDNKFKFHSHIRRRVGVAHGLITNYLCSTVCREEKFLLTLYTSLIRPQLEYASCLWNQGYLGDLRLLERVQRRVTREMSGLNELPYDQRLRHLNLFSFQGRLLRGDLIMVWRIFNGECAIRPDDIFIMETSNRTRGHSLKIFLPRWRLDIRSRFFSVRIIHHWNSLSEDTVSSQSLETFKH